MKIKKEEKIMFQNLGIPNVNDGYTIHTGFQGKDKNYLAYDGIHLWQY